MSSEDFVTEGTRENFNALVIENSRKGLVLVHFWSPRVGPSLLLRQRLTEIAREHGGRFLLVEVNVDEQDSLARELGVISVPFVKFFRRASVIDDLHSAESAERLRGRIRNYLGTSGRHPLHVAGLEAHRRGNPIEASELLAGAALEAPQDLTITTDLGKLLVLNGQYARAQDLLAALPENAQRHPPIARLLIHLGFLRTAAGAPPMDELLQRLRRDDKDPEACYAAAARCVVEDRYEQAMEHLLHLAALGSTFRDDIGTRGLTALFDMLGHQGELVDRFRPRLGSLIRERA